MENIVCVRSSEKYAQSYCSAVESVAKERKYLASTTGFSLDFSINFLKMFEKNNLSQYFALKNDDVVGWCDILPKSYEELSHVGVLGMGVVKQFRRQGIGSKLLEHTIHHAKTINGLEKVELEVFESNFGAILLYKKIGFKIEGVLEKARKMDGKYDNILLMGKFV